MIRSLFFALLGMAIIPLHAQEQKWQLNTQKSEITYTANHLLHPWKGVNKNARGVLVVNPESMQLKEIAVLALVRDFDSNNEGRDSHALEVLEALSYPEVRFYSNLIENQEDALLIHGVLDFHGVKKNTSIVVHQKNKDDQLVLSGTFEIKPSLFEVPLPSFMMVKMDDALTFEFKLEFSP